MMNESYSKLNNINILSIVDSIISIVIPNNIVTDKKFILEFINNTDKSSFKKIEDKLTEINAKGVNKKIDAECANCKHTWVGSVEFDPASFFGIGS